jgi:regulator of sirC expression with transglutaminase-like and TPR domain
MDVTERFTELVRLPDRDLRLDEAALLISAHDHPVDIAAERARLDELAASAPASAGDLARYLFDELGYAGNSSDYGDPRNSYLDAVVRRRLGLPITLSVLMIEIARRRSVPCSGVGMPGHFLVVGTPGEFYDPFNAGEHLDADGCRQRFAQLQPGVPFADHYLDPVGSAAILARMLANLVNSFIARQPASAVWALRLRLRLPGITVAERRDAAALLGRLGSFEEAAAELDVLSSELDGDAATSAERDAATLRARAN